MPSFMSLGRAISLSFSSFSSWLPYMFLFGIVCTGIYLARLGRLDTLTVLFFALFAVFMCYEWTRTDLQATDKNVSNLIDAVNQHGDVIDEIAKFVNYKPEDERAPEREESHQEEEDANNDAYSEINQALESARSAEAQSMKRRRYGVRKWVTRESRESKPPRSEAMDIINSDLVFDDDDELAKIYSDTVVILDDTNAIPEITIVNRPPPSETIEQALLNADRTADQVIQKSVVIEQQTAAVQGILEKLTNEQRDRFTDRLTELHNSIEKLSDSEHARLFPDQKKQQ